MPMTDERAIEVLGDLIYSSYSASQTDTGDALRAGVIALHFKIREEAAAAAEKERGKPW